MTKSKIINVQGVDISIYTHNQEDYICLTDMIKAKDGDFFITDWLRNRNTLEFLGVWETMFNPNFNYGEFAIIRNQAGLNSFKVSVKEWVLKTNSIGLTAKTGRYGGTFAHKDIAFEFGTWISPVFKLYIIKEYQRLKEIESNQYSLEWNVKRILSKANYEVHTGAIRDYIIPHIGFSQKKEWIYASEADMINIIMFRCTAKQWREANPSRVLNGENIRDMASINDLAILSTLEGINASLIKQGIDKKERVNILNTACQDQRKALDGKDLLKSIKKLNDATYIGIEPKDDFDEGMKKIAGFDFNASKKN